MARIAGVNIPSDKQAWVSLTYIYGIGRTKALNILEKAKIKPDVRIKTLSDDELAKIRSVIEQDHTVEGDLRR